MQEKCNNFLQEMTGSDVIALILDDLGVKAPTFAKSIGVNYQRILDIQNGKVQKISPKLAELIIEKYPQYNLAWLLTGMGDKTTQNIKPQQYYGGENSGLPLIPVEAVAGFPTWDVPGISLADCSIYNVPEFLDKGAQFLIRVSGSSMYPKYSNGDILACRKIEAVTFFQWGKVYVLDTNQGVLVKRLFEDKDSSDNVVCHSDNSENYPNFTLPKSEIRSLSIVVGVIRVE